MEKIVVYGSPNLDTANTSYVERHNLTIRMANRRFTRETNAFSKKMSRHEAAMHLFSVYYNFCRIHQPLNPS